MSPDLFPSQADGAAAVQNQHRLLRRSGFSCLADFLILRFSEMMEAGVALLLLAALWLRSDGSFHGNSISSMAPKWNKDGTFTVGEPWYRL